MTDLQVLDLSGTAFQTVLPSALAVNLSGLQSLDLSGNPGISGSFPAGTAQGDPMLVTASSLRRCTMIVTLSLW